MKRDRRTRSRSPLRRNIDRRGNQRDRNSGRFGFSQHSDKMVYFSNLPYEMIWMELKDIVREKAGEVNFIETLEDRNGRSKGCAVVEFKTREGAIKCVENMHRQEIKGRNIVAKEIRDPVVFFRKIKEDTGIDFLGNRDRRNRNDENNRRLLQDDETYGLSPAFLSQLNIKTPLVDRVFISNISFTCGVGRLYDICSLAGKIVWFDLQLDPEGKSKGMAVCQYSHPIEAVQAISMLNGQRIYDRVVTVKMDRFEKEQQRRDGELPIGLRGIGMGLGANGAPLADVASVISSISSNPNSATVQSNQPLSLLNQQFSSNPFGSNVPSVISPFVANPLQQLQQQQQIPSLLQSFNNDLATANGLLNSTLNAALHQNNAPYQSSQQQNSGYYGSSTTLQTPSTLSTSNVSSVPSLFANKVPAPSMNSSAFGSNTGPTPLLGNVGNANSNTTSNSNFGQNTSNDSSRTNPGLFPTSANSYDNQPTRVILIKNLPMDYTWQIVSDRVQQFGDLDSVEIVSPGVAKVRFIQISDAERAKKTLQGTMVEGRVIGIEYL